MFIIPNKHLVIYPANFNPEDEITYFSGYTRSNTLRRGERWSCRMAKFALGLALYEQEQQPKATNPKDIVLENEDVFVLAAPLDLSEYRRKNHAKTIRINNSIPEWSNVLAEKGVSISLKH